MKALRSRSVAALVICALALPAAGAINVYVKIDGIPGDSTASGHTGEIEVLSWSHGFVQPTSPTRSTAGAGTVEQATHQNLTFTKYVDSSSAALLKANWSGKQIATATLTCYRAEGASDNAPVLYLKVEMTNVIISNLNISNAAGQPPTETVALDYGTITYTYVDQNGGTQSASNAPVARHDP